MKKIIYIPLLLLFILLNCIGIKVYEDDGNNKRLSNLIRTGIERNGKWYWDGNFQTIRYGIVFRDATYILMDNKTYSSYNYYIENQIDFGKWEIIDSVVYCTSGFYTTDSITGLNVFYSLYNRKKQKGLCIIDLDSYNGLIADIWITDSSDIKLGGISFIEENSQFIFKKRNANKIHINLQFNKEYISVSIIPKDTILIKPNFIKAKHISENIADLQKFQRVKKSNGIIWYIMDDIKVVNKIFDGAKLLVSKSKKEDVLYDLQLKYRK